MDISVIVPVFNEQDNISPFLARMLPILEKLVAEYEIIFCLDPSTDDTESIIKQYIKKNQQVKLLKLSRRFGQPAATLAGLSQAVGDFMVVIDVDLQDPPELIETMYQRCLNGIEVAYAKRLSRKGETMLKRVVANVGYKVISKLSDCAIPTDTGDFRIMSRRVVEHVLKLDDGQGFLRGMVAYVGFKQEAIPYHREERNQGQTKYNRYLGSLNIGLNGLVGFSRKLLAMLYLPAIVLLVGCLAWAMIRIGILAMGGGAPTGTAIIIWLLCFLSSIQLFGLGVMGEYLGRLYMERPSRPLYIIESFEQQEEKAS